MKLTKHKLKQLIKEELSSLYEFESEKIGGEKLASGAAVKSARETAAQQKAGGITDLERDVIKKLRDQLVNAAQNTNIATGKVLRYANLLSQELQKLGVSDKPENEEADTQV
jgi:hypothetical protein